MSVGLPSNFSQISSCVQDLFPDPICYLLTLIVTARNQNLWTNAIQTDPFAILCYCCDVKRRGVVPPPLATFPGSLIDELADQLQNSNHSVRHRNYRSQNDD